jgi:hypothetical protein
VNKSDVQETLALLYLRLNGYFATGFIVHASHRNKTEMDALAVRFPRHCEPEREIQCCPRLVVPPDRIDFIVGEVKGGSKNANFNSRFREDPYAIRSALNRFGAFDEPEIDSVCKRIPAVLNPIKIRNAGSIPTVLPLCDDKAQLRFVLFAPDLQRRDRETRPYIFGEDLIKYVWSCFRPEQRRRRSDDKYNYELWGPQFVPMVQYFKDRNKTSHGTIDDLYATLMDKPISTARRVSVTDDALTVDLSDDRTISVPLAWLPRLTHGTEVERSNWTLVADGEGIHWPDLDEDLSVEGLLAGRRSGESQESLQRWLDGRRAPPSLK